MGRFQKTGVLGRRGAPSSELVRGGRMAEWLHTGGWPGRAPGSSTAAVSLPRGFQRATFRETRRYLRGPGSRPQPHLLPKVSFSSGPSIMPTPKVPSAPR